MPRRYRVVILLCLSCVLGCGYPEVSPAAYEFSKALVSITNRQDSDGLASIRNKIAEATKTGEITDRESQWLTAIVAEAEAGDWRSGQEHARRMMADQVKQ